jgi:hypothetical protein
MTSMNPTKTSLSRLAGHVFRDEILDYLDLESIVTLMKALSAGPLFHLDSHFCHIHGRRFTNGRSDGYEGTKDEDSEKSSYARFTSKEPNTKLTMDETTVTARRTRAVSSTMVGWDGWKNNISVDTKSGLRRTQSARGPPAVRNVS